MSSATTELVRAALEKSPLIDGHNDLLIRMRSRVSYDFDSADLAADQTAAGFHTDIPRLRAGGVGGQFWSVFVPANLTGETAVTATLEQIDAAHEMIARYDDLALATTADEVEAAWEAGHIASLLGAEGGHSIGDSLGTLRMLYRLGVRYMTLTHSANLPWADSATDEAAAGGLTRFGREVVAEMNRLGMLVDLSHVAATTMRDALDSSVAPAFFSHSNTFQLCSHPRNVPDDVIARVGDTNGVIMATFVPGFVNEACHEWMNALEDFEGRGRATWSESSDEEMKRWLADNPCPGASAAEVADHIEHIRDVAGVDCVGIGGDFDGIGTTPSDLPDVAAYPRLLEELASRGWSDGDLGKLTSRNVLRVMRDTEAVARQLAATTRPSHSAMSELDG